MPAVLSATYGPVTTACIFFLKKYLEYLDTARYWISLIKFVAENIAQWYEHSPEGVS